MRCPVTKIFGGLFSTFLVYASVDAADKIRIAVPDPTAQFITFPLAQKKGFFKEEGLDVEVIQIVGSSAPAALVNGEIDYFTGLGSTVSGILQGLPLKIVACYAPASTYMLIARPEITSVPELKGKTLGVAAYGHGSHIIARLVVRHFGLDPEKDIKFLPIGSGRASREKLSQGLIDATVSFPPFVFQEQKQGFNVLARAYELFSSPQSVLSVHVKKITERPDEIRRVIKAGIRANRYIRGNRDGMIEFLMERYKIDREIAAATHESLQKAFSDDGSIPEMGLRLVIEEAKKSAKVEREVPFSEVADLSILTRAQKELGIQGK